jgi:uncharacterized protein YcnI
MRISPVTRISAALGAGTLLAIAAPLAASAHVTINPDAAEAGSYAVVTVKVPNESDTATTTKVQLSLPEDTPFTSVRHGQRHRGDRSRHRHHLDRRGGLGDF